eukprot:460190-Amphidinium_carterae.1
MFVAVRHCKRKGRAATNCCHQNDCEAAACFGSMRRMKTRPYNAAHFHLTILEWLGLLAYYTTSHQADVWKVQLYGSEHVTRGIESERANSERHAEE